MDFKRDNNSSIEARENNIKRLLKSALTPVPAATFFKRGLLLHLKDELLKSTGGESAHLKSPDALEENLSRLMVSSYEHYEPVQAAPGFKERLRDEIITAGSAAQRKRRLNVLSPALAATVVGVMLFVVFLFGIEIYPTYWADKGDEITFTMIEGTGTAKETRPLFFIWGTRTTKSNLTSGETASLSEGDKISTGSGSKALISLFNESTIELFPDSLLGINKLESSGELFASVNLEAGRATSKINNFSYELKTPSASAVVSGTAFQTEVISDEHTYLATSEGAVNVTMNGETVEVREGEEIDAVKGQKLEVKEASLPILENISPEDPLVYSPDIILTGKTDVEAELTVNGEPVPVNLDGTFSVELNLVPGPNTFLIIATNPAGKTRDLTARYILM